MVIAFPIHKVLSKFDYARSIGRWAMALEIEGDNDLKDNEINE